MRFITCTSLFSYILRILQKKTLFIKVSSIRDFPGGPVVKNPPCNAGHVGLIPGWGTKIPHATEQVSLCLATRVCAPS